MLREFSKMLTNIQITKFKVVNCMDKETGAQIGQWDFPGALPNCFWCAKDQEIIRQTLLSLQPSPTFPCSQNYNVACAVKLGTVLVFHILFQIPLTSDETSQITSSPFQLFHESVSIPHSDFSTYSSQTSDNSYRRKKPYFLSSLSV